MTTSRSKTRIDFHIMNATESAAAETNHAAHVAQTVAAVANNAHTSYPLILQKAAEASFSVVCAESGTCSVRESALNWQR